MAKHSSDKKADAPFDLRAALAGTFLSLIVMMPLTYKYLEYRLASQPVGAEIVVMDFAAVLAKQASQSGASETLPQTVQALDETISRLGEAGFVVLDSDAVLYAPADMHISTDVLGEAIASHTED